MPPGIIQHKDQVNHCYVCGERFTHRQTPIRCSSCGREVHEPCHDHAHGSCPRCGGDAWLDAAEF